MLLQKYDPQMNFSHIQTRGGGGGGGGAESDARTLNVNNFLNIEANASKVGDTL